jgi:hypothetical protein
MKGGAGDSQFLDKPKVRFEPYDYTATVERTASKTHADKRGFNSLAIQAASRFGYIAVEFQIFRLYQEGKLS